MPKCLAPVLNPHRPPPLQPPPSPTHIIQQFSLHSEFPGSHLVSRWGSSRGPCGSCIVTFCLAGTECIGNIDPQLSFLLKRERQQARGGPTCWKTMLSNLPILTRHQYRVVTTGTENWEQEIWPGLQRPHNFIREERCATDSSNTVGSVV